MIVHVRSFSSPEKIFAVSDLHVGAVYSAWKRDMPLVEKGIREADTIVLCGDMFEGTQQLIALNKRVSMVKEVLRDIARINPYAVVHVMFGNHEQPILRGGEAPPEDAHYMEVAKVVRGLADKYSNVVFHERGQVQIGDIVFTHGHREMGFTEDVPNRMSQLSHLPLNYVLPGLGARALVFPTGKTIEAMHQTLSQQTFQQPVNHVVFGHTHGPMSCTLEGKRLGNSTQDVQFHKGLS